MRPTLSTLAAPLLCLSFAANAEPVSNERPASPVPDARGATASGSEAWVATSSDGTVLPLRARLDKDAIRAAIAALPAETGTDSRRLGGDTLSAAPTERFSQEFAKARLPDCLHSEGLRNQPTFFLSGVLALPFIAVAKVRGVCR